MAESFFAHRPTAEDLAAQGFRLISHGLVRRASRVYPADLWGNPDTGKTVRVICAKRKAGKSAGRGHWKFHPLASWWRWHFGKGR